MRRRIPQLALLTLCACIVPTLLAQDSHSKKRDNGHSGTGLAAWTEAQRPQPLPSPQTYLSPQEPTQRIATPRTIQQPTPGQQDDIQKPGVTQTFAGTVMKSGNQYLLRTADNVTYQLDDRTRAKEYEGKQVQVTGNLDENTGMIHVLDIKAAA
jgi:Protein of unknown function (DUF5818)